MDRVSEICLVLSLWDMQLNLPQAATQNAKLRWLLVRAQTIMGQNVSSLEYGNFRDLPIF